MGVFDTLAVPDAVREAVGEAVLVPELVPEEVLVGDHTAVVLNHALFIIIVPLVVAVPTVLGCGLSLTHKLAWLSALEPRGVEEYTADAPVIAPPLK